VIRKKTLQSDKELRKKMHQSLQFSVLYSDLSKDQEQMSIRGAIEVIEKTEIDVASYLKSYLEAQNEVR
jgi:predicted RNA-binding protein with EMAP domain